MKTALAILLFCLSARANVVFNSGPPNDNANDFVNQRLADDFTLASAASIDTIDFWYQANFQTDLSAVAWAIYDDASGALGAQIDSGEATPATSFDATDDAYYGTFSITELDLAAGTYWLELHAGSSLTDDNGGYTVWWAASDYSNVYPALSNSAGGTPDTAVTISGYETYAFELEDSTQTSAPEPSAWMLVCAGLAGLIWLRLRS